MLGAIAAGFNQQYDVVLAGSSALSTWLPFAWFVNLRKKPAIYSVNDVYPDVGIKLGVFKNRFVITVIAALERFCLHGSTIVQIISDSFRPGLRALGVPDSKMALLQLWVDTNIIRPLSRDNSFAVEQGLTDQFVVLYAGNLGRSQGLEHILHAAELLAGEHDIRFVFVGDAAGRELLQKEAQRKNLSNVQFIPFQPRDRLPEVLASADISLVVLRRGIGSDSLPSKTFSIMASGRPILASVDEESEAWKLVKRAESGIWVQPEDPHRMAEAILTLKRDSALRERLGCNGRVWTERYHSPEYAAEQFEKLFSDAISLKRGS
jgi:colanic acid biosynthesis glycosyl transferase WcaI